MQDDQPETPWEFKPGDAASPDEQPAPAPEPALEQPETSEPETPAPSVQGPINWTASEFIAHSKSANWYLSLALAAIVITGLVYLLTRDKISSAVVIVAALALAAYAGRQPRQLQYGVDAQGLTIGDKHFPYEMFRSFAVMDEGAFSSISFLPLKRFGQLTTIYYDPKDEDAIIDLLSQRLPLEPRQHDAVDRFMKRIRF